MVAALEGGHAAVVELLAAAGGEVPSHMSGRALIMAEKHGLQALLATTATQQVQRRNRTADDEHSGRGKERKASDAAEAVGGGAEDADADAWLDEVLRRPDTAGGRRGVMTTVDRGDNVSSRATAATSASEKKAARAEAVRAMAFAGLEAGQEQEDMRFLAALEKWQKDFWTQDVAASAP